MIRAEQKLHAYSIFASFNTFWTSVWLHKNNITHKRAFLSWMWSEFWSYKSKIPYWSIKGLDRSFKSTRQQPSSFEVFKATSVTSIGSGHFTWHHTTKKVSICCLSYQRNCFWEETPKACKIQIQFQWSLGKCNFKGNNLLPAADWLREGEFTLEVYHKLVVGWSGWFVYGPTSRVQ